MYSAAMKRMSRDPVTWEVFWDRVNRAPHPKGCWIYEGYITPAGYGVVKIEGKHWPVHRLIYVLSTGVELPPKLFVCHHCDVRPCCNPDHMFVGTQKDNIADMCAKGRKFLTVGNYKSNSVLTEDIVRAARKWHQEQRKEHREYGLAAYARSLGIHHKTLLDAMTGKTWKHLP